MKKLIFGALLLSAFSLAASAQTAQKSKTAPAQKPSIATTQKQPNKASPKRATTTQTTVMTRPKHKKHKEHKAMHKTKK